MIIVSKWYYADTSIPKEDVENLRRNNFIVFYENENCEEWYKIFCTALTFAIKRKKSIDQISKDFQKNVGGIFLFRNGSHISRNKLHTKIEDKLKDRTIKKLMLSISGKKPEQFTQIIEVT